jgi:hypothetical protein
MSAQSKRTRTISVRRSNPLSSRAFVKFFGRADSRSLSIRQAAAIRLSEAGASWLGEELEGAFRRHGRLRAEEMPGLDWD